MVAESRCCVKLIYLLTEWAFEAMFVGIGRCEGVMEKIKIKPDVLRYPKQVTVLGIDAGGIDAFRLLD